MAGVPNSHRVMEKRDVTLALKSVGIFNFKLEIILDPLKTVHCPNGSNPLEVLAIRVVADVARLQVAPQKIPNSGESGYSEVRPGSFNDSFGCTRKARSGSKVIRAANQFRLWAA